MCKSARPSEPPQENYPSSLPLLEDLHVAPGGDEQWVQAEKESSRATISLQLSCPAAA